jgi:GNAT superfamily N-acetyltransferase
MSLSLTLHENVPDDVGRTVDTGLGESNDAATPLHEVRAICCAARLDTGELVGGVVGRTWGLCCEVQQLWVRPSHRRQGIGRRLMRELHRAAEARGCRRFYLQTWSFQVPQLYRSLGYDVRLEIQGFRPGIVKYIMVHELPLGGI